MAVDSSMEGIAPNTGTSTATSRSQNEPLDLGAFMDHYYAVRDQVWPLGRVVVEIQKIRRWENYSLSLSVTITLSVLILYPRALTAFTTGLLFMFILAGNHHILGSFLGTKIKKKISTTPNLINNDAEVMDMRSREERNRRRSLRDYRYIVKKADNTVVELGHVLDMIKSIYMWEDTKLSINVCFFLFLVTLSMLWLSVSSLLSILTVLFFCLNNHFITRTKSIFLNIRSYFPQLRFSQQVSQNTNNSTLRAAASIIDPLSRRLIVPEAAQQPDELLTSSGEVNERTTNKKDKVNCYKCGVPFTLLKRKHQCSNCGQVFCASCTTKVTKANLGATSPAAFQQMVRVCQECKNELEARNSGSVTLQPTTN